MNSPAITAILQESLLLFFTIGSVFALVLGMLLILAPQLAKRFSQQNNRWISLRRSTRALEIPHHIDHRLYHHHRFIGLFILLSSGYILYRFGFDYHHAAAVSALTAGVNSTITSWLLEALLWFLVPVSLVLVVVGAIMALKPSSMRRVESSSNQWISTRQASQGFEKQNFSLDRWVDSHPRLFGMLLCLAALYNLSLLLLFMFNK